VKIISHRGNLNGRKANEENHPEYLRNALKAGFNVEVDVWFVEGKLLLGHDKPLYEINERFLTDERMWCHVKNLSALERLLLNKKINCFWHENDNYALTSKGQIWTHKNNKINKNCIIMSNSVSINKLECFGICTDFPVKYQKLLKLV